MKNHCYTRRQFFERSALAGSLLLAPGRLLARSTPSKRTASDQVTLNDEAENHRWVPLEAAAKFDLNTPTRILLDHVRSHPRG